MLTASDCSISTDITNLLLVDERGLLLRFLDRAHVPLDGLKQTRPHHGVETCTSQNQHGTLEVVSHQQSTDQLGHEHEPESCPRHRQSYRLPPSVYEERVQCYKR